MITTSQVRAGRSILGWSQDDLAEKSGINRRTVNLCEKTSRSSNSTMIAIQKALEEAGLEFGPEDMVKRRGMVRTLTGENIYTDLYEDIYQTLKDIPEENREVLIYGVTEAPIADTERRKVARKHLDRLERAGIREKLISRAGDTNFLAPVEYYRWIPEENFHPCQLTVYDKKIALKEFKNDEYQIVIINNEAFANGLRGLIQYSWDHCRSPIIAGDE